jgi:WD40 repeat protein
VWEVAPSQRVATLFDYRAPAAQLLFAPSAPALLWRTTDARLYLWGVRAEAKLPAPLPDAITSANVLRLQRQTHLGRGRLLSAAWSPADQYLAVNTTENALVYALAGNALKLARAFLGQRVLTFDGEGRALMAGGGEPVRLVDVTTGQVTRRFKFADARAAAFSPDGQLLALAGPVTPGSQDDGLAVIELSDELTRISQPGRGRYKDTPKLEFSPDSQRLVVSYVGAITIWDLSANAPVRNTITSNTRPASLSPDGKLLAYFTDRFVIETLDKGGQYRTISAAGSEFFPGGINLPNYTPIDHVFTPGGKLLIYYRKLNQRTLQESVALVEWNADSPGANITVSDLFRLTGTPGLYVDDYERSRAIRVPAFGLSPTGQHLYSLTADGVARVWRYPAGQLLDASGTDYTDLLALHPNGQTVAVPNAFGHIELRDLNTGELKNELNGPWSPAGMVFNSPSLLLVAQPDEDEAGTLALVDTERNAVVETFQGPRYYRFGAMSGDGRLLAMWQIASGGVFLNVMPLSAARPLLELGRYPRPDELAFSPDSSRLAVVRGKQVEVWNLHTGQIAFKLSVQRNVVGNLAFSPDGARLIAASGEIWSASDGGLLATFDSTTDLIRLGPQGDFILGRDGTLWNVMTGQPIDQLPGLRGPAFHVAFTADGRRLVIQDDQGIIEVWGVS